MNWLVSEKELRWASHTIHFLQIQGWGNKLEQMEVRPRLHAGRRPWKRDDEARAREAESRYSNRKTQLQAKISRNVSLQWFPFTLSFRESLESADEQDSSETWPPTSRLPVTRLRWATRNKNLRFPALVNVANASKHVGPVAQTNCY